MTGRKLGLRKRIGLRLFSDLYAEKIAEHKLRTLFWECTLRCNLACRHCGSDCRVDPGVPDMPLADFLKVLDEEVTPHNRPEDVLLIFSGGEVLVRSDLEEAGREVTRRGYAWGMVTNGLALDADCLRSLMDAGLRSISISFDGFEDAHNYIRRNPRSFGKALDAIRLIVREPRLTYDVITCVTSPMVARLGEFKELLIAEGVKYWRIFSIFPVGRAKDDPTLTVTDAQFREVLEFIKRTRKEGRIDLSYACEGFLGGYEARCGTISTSAPPGFRLPRSGWTGRFRAVPPSGPISIRGIFTGTVSGTCGRIASTSSATANGPAKGSAPIARCGVSVWAAVCTCTTTRSI